MNYFSDIIFKIFWHKKYIWHIAFTSYENSEQNHQIQSYEAQYPAQD